MSAPVKGYQMSAHDSKHHSVRERLVGRRLISLRGGNRGVRQRG